MELSKHKAHRNLKYLNWLRKRKCAVSGKPAECVHHIRIGTNGGTGLKPSDYFCIPLLNEFHTTGSHALHIIGEETFLRHFKLNYLDLFAENLKAYLSENFDFIYADSSNSAKQIITDLIVIIESKTLRTKKTARPKAKNQKDPIHEKAKLIKNKKDKDLRRALKKPVKEDEFYQISKNIKRERDKVFRSKMKDEQSEALSRAKEAQKIRQKEFKDKQKKKAAAFRKKTKKPGV